MKERKRLLIAISVIIVFLFVVLIGYTVYKPSHAATLYSGTSNTCTWTISDAGLLNIKPTSGTSCTLASMGSSDTASPWYNYRSSVKRVTFTNTVNGGASIRSLFADHTALTNVNLTNFYTSNTTNMRSLFDGDTALTTITWGSNFTTANNTTFYCFFRHCSSLTSINVSSFNTSKAADFVSMFNDCSKATSITGLNNFNTSKATSFINMFIYCAKLTSLNVSSFTIRTDANVSMLGMFRGCKSLTSITGLSGFNTSRVTSMSGMFRECEKITTLDLSNFSSAVLTDISFMFYGCSLLTSVDFGSGFTTQLVTTMQAMFNNCASLTSFIAPNFRSDNLENMRSMFNGCTHLLYAQFLLGSGFTTEKVKDMAYAFAYCPFYDFDLIYFHSDMLEDMEGMFAYCSNLWFVNFDYSIFTASSVTNMSYLFYNCSSLGSTYTTSSFPNGSWFDTSSVQNFSHMFDGCSSIHNIDGDFFDTSSATQMQYMFAGCSSLETLDVTNFDTGSVTQMQAMFENCSSLESLDLSTWDTRNVLYTYSMFRWCTSLTDVDVAGWNSSSLTSMGAMFAYCNSLENVNFEDAPNFTASSVTNMQNMFLDCNSIEVLDLRYFNTTVLTNARDFIYSKNYMNIKELNLANFDTRNNPALYNFFGTDNDLSKITLGPNFRITPGPTTSYTFGRGTWRKQNGDLVSAAEIVLLSQTQSVAGTYTKVNNIISSMVPDYTPTYKINLNSSNFDKNASVLTNNSFHFVGNSLYYRITSPISQADYSVPGSATLKFVNAAEDEFGNKYDVTLKIDNLILYDMDQYNDLDVIEHNFFGVLDERVAHYCWNWNSDYTQVIATSAGSKHDTEIKILDKQGNVVQGDFIFSAYDLDIGSTRDIGSQYPLSDTGRGFGTYSEGINLISGYDTTFDTYKVHPNTYLIRNNNRIFGIQSDKDTELSEFSIKADASGLKYAWTGNYANTYILSYYQPKNVEINIVNASSHNIAGAYLKLYQGSISPSNLVEEWTSTVNSKKIFLNPGLYVLHEETPPVGYTAGSDVTFSVDIDDKLTINNTPVESVNLVNTSNSYSYTINYVEKGTNVLLDTESHTANYGQVVEAEDYVKAIAKYVYDSVDNDSIVVNAEGNTINIYYRKKQIIKKYVSDANETKVKGNTVAPEETFTYDIIVEVPTETTYYESWKVEDTISSDLTYVSAAVYNESNTNVTSSFTITYSNHKLTVTANSPGNASFYGHTYDIRITVHS